MAKAYLGKISALVTANTSDFNSKLNASANELRNFAKSVQSNITRTTQDANRAFSAILTPLQKFEASLRAASSMRLSFKGFQGAIKDVEELKARLATLKDSQVNLVVNASGMKSLTDFRNAIGDITNKDIRVLTDVGGIEKLRELRNIIETEDGRTIATQVRVKAEDLDRIIAKFERIDKRQIDAVIRVLGEQDLEAAVVKQQQLASAAKQVAEPLAAAVAQFGKLSTEVQTAFIPALNRAQDATQNLQSDIEAGVRIGQERFKALESQVLRTAEAIGRLSEAAATVSTIRTGRELEFQQPRAQAALTAARAVSGEAVGNVALNPRAFEASQAAIKRESDALVELIALRESANEQGERGTASVIQAQIDTRTASLERQTAEYRRLIAAEKEAAAAQQQAGAGPLIARARAEREYYEESRRLANQAAADAAAPLIARASAERDFYEESERLQRQAASDEAALLIRRARAQQEFEDERRRLAAVAAEDAAAEIAPAINRARVQRESAIDFGLDLDAPKRQLEVLRGSVVSVKGQLDALPVSIRSQFVPAILEAQRNLEALAAAPAATTEQIENAAAEVDRLSAATRRASQASQVQGFGDFINDANVRQAVGELQGLQRVLIQVGAVAGGPAARAYEAYRARLQEAISTGTTGLPTVRRELERLQRAAVEAAAATGRISVGNAFRQIQRAGDVARGGVDRLSLALNQAAFAIDDFFSSTGGIEFKLRAVSNNITQLAFILGNTTGLFIGLGAVIGGQLAVAIAKYAFGLEDAKKRQEALKAQADALNATLDRQKNLVEELASAYRDLGRDIKQATLSPQGARFEQRQERAQEVRQQQADRRREQVAGIVPAVAANRGRRQQLEAQINELPLGAERAAAQRRADRLRAQEDQVVARVERAAAARVGQNQAGLRDRRDFFQNRLDSLQRDRAKVARDSGERDPRIAVFDRQINEAGEQLAEFTIALQRINDEAISTAFQFSGPLQDAIQRAQERLSSAFGDQRAPQQDTLDRAGRALGDLPGRITSENLSPAGTRRAIADVEALARPAIEAANRLADFATALTDARESARRADEEARQRVQDLQSEVSRNPNDRTLQAQLRAAQAGAAELGQRRQAVERDVQRGFGEAGLGPQANQTRQQQVRTDSDAASRFAEDLKRQGDLIAEGFDIARPALEEFGRKLEQDLIKLGEAAKADRQNAAQLIEDGRRNLAEQAAPMFVEMAKSVQNAVIAGPSRAALNASDVTTSQGQQELNRLLRGDDPAREADFVEMKNQTQKLTSIDAGIQKLVNQIGVAQ